ncbi:MAG: hypothetical protein IPM82_29860 [Saprospiraceae bacterium]|nr:hypothetical protein [Saprospiraceae bacterium]
MDSGTSQAFNVTYSDPEGDAVIVEWYVDNILVSSGASLTFSPTNNDVGLHVMGIQTF